MYESKPRPPFYFKRFGITYHWENCVANRYPAHGWERSNVLPQYVEVACSHCRKMLLKPAKNLKPGETYTIRKTRHHTVKHKDFYIGKDFTYIKTEDDQVWVKDSNDVLHSFQRDDVIISEKMPS